MKRVRRQNHSCDQCRKAKRACDAPSLGGAIPRRGSLENASSSREKEQESIQKTPLSGEHKSTSDLYPSTDPVVFRAEKQVIKQTENRTRRLEALYGFSALARPDIDSSPGSSSYDFQPVFTGFGDADSFSAPGQLSNFACGGLLSGSPGSLASARHGCSISDSSSIWGPLSTGVDMSFSSTWSDLSPQTYLTARSYTQSFPSGPEEENTSNDMPSRASGLHRMSRGFGDRQWGSYYGMDNSRLAFSPLYAEHVMIARSNNSQISENLLRIYHDVLEHSLSCWVTEDTCPYKMGHRRRTRRPIRGGDRIRITQQQHEWGRNWSMSNRFYQRVVKLDGVARSARLIRLTRDEDRAALRALHLAIMAFATQWAQGSRRELERYRSSFAREEEFARATTIPEDLEGDGTGLAEEFDRRLQRSLWEQARQALQNCADIECYRVVCAELIFGLTQKPWGNEDGDCGMAGRGEDDEEDNNNVSATPHGSLAGNNGRNGSNSRGSNTMALVLRQLRGIMSKDGPPVFIERAARKMHALKFHFDGHEMGTFSACCSADNKPPRHTSSAAGNIIGEDDRETVGLLYWLVVMIDTVSGSMNERPVVVADEDSQHDGAHDGGDDVPGTDSAQVRKQQDNILHQNQTQQNNNNRRWRIDLFIQDDPEGHISNSQQQEQQQHSFMGHPSQQPLRWPCSYEAAARAVTRSAPVKVLLYRHVHYLQSSLRRQPNNTSKGQESIEEIIHSALLVHRYWNQTYGAFFADLIEQFPSVPARIQSWFFCIVAHWHLAALMLADLVELVDRVGLGMEEGTQARLAAGTVAAIRSSSAGQLADLAQIAAPALRAGQEPSFRGIGGSSGSSESWQFHSAVSEGAILTEPWTMILIRAFAKACVLHLEAAERQGLLLLRRGGRCCWQDEDDGHLRRGEECVRALWLLGKKSDMARSVAGVLSRALVLSAARRGGDVSSGRQEGIR